MGEGLGRAPVLVEDSGDWLCLFVVTAMGSLSVPWFGPPVSSLGEGRREICHCCCCISQGLPSAIVLGTAHIALKLCLCLQLAVPGPTFLRPQGLLQAAVLAAGVSHAPSPNDVCVSEPPSSPLPAPPFRAGPCAPLPHATAAQGHGLGHCGPINYPVGLSPVMLIKLTLHCPVW